MGKLSMNSRLEIINKYKFDYRKVSKKDKSLILTIVCQATGYSRDRATRLLNGNLYSTKKASKNKRGRKIIYDTDVIDALTYLWHLLDFACSKRLKAAIPLMIDALERHNEMSFNSHLKDKLLHISAASIDRLLKPVRVNLTHKGISTTKPGTLLKHNIPIRLGTEWNDAIPGFVEIDLVAHCGSSTSGEYANTLDVTDICSGWTETRAVINKAQKHVFNALMHIENNLPFNYRGIDSDNGSEFINNELYRYCKDNNICFTRGRPNKSNDNCYVGQKNWSVIRRNIGYSRFEGQETVDALNFYYDKLRLYTNFFLPQTKLISKERVGAKLKKKYEAPKTPYQRILEDRNIDDETKKELREQYLKLNPVKIKAEMIKRLEIIEAQSLPYEYRNKKTK